MFQESTRGVTRRTGGIALAGALLVGVLASVVGATAASADSTVTVSNNTAITIPDSGNANPYPSAITASGIGTSITGLKVVVRNTSHGCVKDLDVLLVGPTGAKTVLFSDNGNAAISIGCSDLNKTSITIDDSCADFDNSVPGGANICVRPSDNDALGHQADTWGDGLNDAQALNLSTFNGTNPNGVWKLYVVDDSGDDSGSFGGWDLKITTANTAPTVNPQVIQANKGEAAPFTITGSDPDGGTLTCQVPTSTASGKGLLGGSGCNRTFTAGTRTSGTDKVTVRMTDPVGAQSGPADIVFNIVNRLPVATDQTITVGRGERVALTLGGADPDPGESFALTCQPTLGNTARGKVSGSGCNVTYEAGTTNGSDSFPFIVSDGFGGTEAGVVNVTVADPNLPGCTSTDTKDARYICRVYLDLLGRSADPSGKAYWINRLSVKKESRVTIIRQYQTTPEYGRRVVDGIYQTFLQRNPDKNGQTFWAGKIRKGANPDQIRAEVIGSSEYFNKSGASPAGFAAAMYQQVTRTPATQAQINSVTSQIAAGKARGTIATALLATAPADTATVQGMYEKYLRRTPPAAEVTYWVNKLQSGVTELKIVEATVSSNEYYNRS